MIQVGVLGSTGRSGKWVIQLIGAEFSSQLALASAVHRGGNLDDLLKADVVIDFSAPEAACALFEKIIQIKTNNPAAPVPAIVSATTGWSLEQRKLHDAASKLTPVLISSNFSLGVMTYLQALKTMGPLLEKLGYSAHIIETHHKHKKDSPSGTAISMQRAIAPAGPGNIPVHSIRAGEVIGAHTVLFHGPGDELEFSHRAEDRSIFARGAIRAALWLTQKRLSPKLYKIEEFFQSLSS